MLAVTPSTASEIRAAMPSTAVRVVRQLSSTSSVAVATLTRAFAQVEAQAFDMLEA